MPTILKTKNLILKTYYFYLNDHLVTPKKLISSKGGAAGFAKGSGKAFGPIITEHGPYIPNTIDWDPTGTRPSKVILDNNKPCSCGDYDKKNSDILDKITNSRYNYKAAYRNSNSVVGTVIRKLGCIGCPPRKFSPGCGNNL